MLSFKKIKNLDVRSTFPSKAPIATSIDNKLCVLHRKGATIFELVIDPIKNRNLIRTCEHIECPKVIETFNTGREGANILVNRSKNEVFELLRDRLIAPRDCDGVDFYNVFSKASWSPSFFFGSPLPNSQSLLAILTSTFTLEVYGILEKSNYSSICNITKHCNDEYLLNWSVLDSENASNHSSFDEYKKRMKQISIVDFTWVPSFNLKSKSISESHIFIAVAHSNSIVEILSLSQKNGEKRSGSSNQLEASIICSKKCCSENEIVSAMEICPLSNNLGILALGTNNGTVRIFKIEHFLEDNITKFSIGEGVVELYAPDQLSIQSFSFIKCNNKDEKNLSANLIFIKHPTHIFSTKITLSSNSSKITFKKLAYSKSLHGPIVGIDKYNNEMLFTLHPSGLLSTFLHKDGKVVNLPNSKLVSSLIKVKDSSKTNNEVKRSIFYYSGLVFSPNKAFLYVGKDLNCFYDHLYESHPSTVLTFSTASTKTPLWERLKASCIEQDGSIRRVKDLLLSFKCQLEAEKESDIRKYSGNLPLCKMDLIFLRLYYFALKSLHLPVIEDLLFGTGRKRNIKRDLIMEAILAVEDELMQRHCSRLFSFSEKNSKSLNEIQSLTTAQKFLGSKRNRYKNCQNLNDFPKGPKCLICSSEMEFAPKEESEISEELMETDIASSELDVKKEISKKGEPSSNLLELIGHEWEKQVCENGHKFPICCITLLPLSFRYRTCERCNKVANDELVFDLEPLCPFCGDGMYLFESSNVVS